MVAGPNPKKVELTKGRKLHNIQKLTAKHMNNIFGSTYKKYRISVLPSQPRPAAISRFYFLQIITEWLIFISSVCTGNRK